MDFTVQNHGSIFLLQSLTPAAQTWVDEFRPKDAQYFGTAVAVEHRYILSIVDGIQGDALEVK
jgi:hypothetical protein